VTDITVTVDVDFTHRPKSGTAAGDQFIAALTKSRDALAHGLLRAGATPNVLTVLGCLLTCAAAACLVVGAGHVPPWERASAGGGQSWYPLIAASILLVAFAFDVLDGAVARVGGMTTPFGAVLDSTLDRISDMALFGGCALYFAWHANVTYVAVSIAALSNAVLISYVKARAENLVGHCGVGSWQRGERCVLLLFAAIVGHIPAALWVLGTFPFFTAVRRLRHAHRRTAQRTLGQPSGWKWIVQPWRHRRASLGYVLASAALFAFVLFGHRVWPLMRPDADPLRVALAAIGVEP
jgi:CDP-diacylglycerol--glycerol-3-phosphate 3-phosphatidyltransferase